MYSLSIKNIICITSLYPVLHSEDNFNVFLSITIADLIVCKKEPSSTVNQIWTEMLQLPC